MYLWMGGGNPWLSKVLAALCMMPKCLRPGHNPAFAGATAKLMQTYRPEVTIDESHVVEDQTRRRQVQHNMHPFGQNAALQ